MASWMKLNPIVIIATVLMTFVGIGIVVMLAILNVPVIAVGVCGAGYFVFLVVAALALQIILGKGEKKN